MTEIKTVLTLTDNQIKRLDEVVEFKKDPLEPFKKLNAYLVDALSTAKSDGKDEITFNVKELINLLPRKSDIAVVSHLLPGVANALLSEGGATDLGDADHNVYDSDYNDGDNRPDTAGDI